MKTIIFFCAHEDDLSVGAIGTILKYIDEGYKIVEVVFSKGQSSHPHLKEEVITKIRKQEISSVARQVGIKELIFLNLTDTKLSKEVELKQVKDELKEIIKKYKPERIFVPTSLDPHPDHRAVNKVTLEILESLKTKPELYSFEVWNLSKQNVPKLYIDITPYFKKKIEIMKKFKSQWFSMYLLMLPVYLRARSNGRKINVKYAERFFILK